MAKKSRKSKKSKKSSITINKKMMLGIAPTLPIIGVLLSKNQPGQLLLFLVGIAAGTIIGYNYKEAQK